MMKGIGSSEGYGIGRVLTIKEINLEFTPKDNCVPSEELKRYKEAVDRFCRKTEKIPLICRGDKNRGLGCMGNASGFRFIWLYLAV